MNSTAKRGYTNGCPSLSAAPAARSSEVLWKRRNAGACAIALGIVMAASMAHAQTTIVSVSGVNYGLILGPANGNVVVDIQFSLTQEFNNVSIAAPLLGGSTGSVADFYLTTQVGPGTTSANAVASSTGVTVPFGSQYILTTIFSGLDLTAGTYNLVFGGTAGFPVLGYTNPGPGTVTLYSGVTYGYLSTQSGTSYEPASALSASTVAFNFQVTGNAVLPTIEPGISSNTFFVGSAGGSGSVALSYDGAWTASSNSSFLHVSSGSAGGTGSAVVAFTYDAFTQTGTRTGTVTIAGFTVTVTQAGTNYLGRGVATLATAGLAHPIGLALDGSGNLYIADTGDSAIKELSASTPQATTLASGLSGPQGVAVDGSGNVYIADTGHSAIKEWNASTKQVTTLVSSGLNQPTGVAVDGSGNVYIADTSNNAIKEWVASTKQVITLVSSGLSLPDGVAVDTFGNVYTADNTHNAIKEWIASTQQVTTLVSSGLNGPSGVAVDGAGNVYIADTGNSAIKECIASTGQVTTLASPYRPQSVAADVSGDVYWADDRWEIQELPIAFIGLAGFTEGAAAGSDSLLQALPSTAPLAGFNAPTSDQSWLTIGSVVNGVVSFSFTAKRVYLPRGAHHGAGATDHGDAERTGVDGPDDRLRSAEQRGLRRGSVHSERDGILRLAGKLQFAGGLGMHGLRFAGNLGGNRRMHHPGHAGRQRPVRGCGAGEPEFPGDASEPDDYLRRTFARGGRRRAFHGERGREQRAGGDLRFDYNLGLHGLRQHCDGYCFGNLLDHGEPSGERQLRRDFANTEFFGRGAGARLQRACGWQRGWLFIGRTVLHRSLDREFQQFFSAYFRR